MKPNFLTSRGLIGVCTKPPSIDGKFIIYYFRIFTRYLKFINSKEYSRLNLFQKLSFSREIYIKDKAKFFKVDYSHVPEGAVIYNGNKLPQIEGGWE